MSVSVEISEASGLLQSEFGMLQAPLKSYIERNGDITTAEEKLWLDVFDERESSHFAEAYSYETEAGDMEPVGEGGDYPTTGYQEGYQKVIHNVTFKQSMSITAEAIEDGVLTDLKRKSDKIIRGYHRGKARLMAAMVGNALQGNATFNFKGWTMGTACMDNLCVFSKVHTLKVAGGTQSNLYADAFSETNLFKALMAMENLVDDDGNNLDIHPDTIIIPKYNAALVKQVLTVVGTPKTTGNGNNDINPLYGNFRVLCSAYLNNFVDQSASNPPWILFDSTYNKENNGNIYQKRLDLKIRSELAANDSNVWKARARYGLGFADWRQMMAFGVTGGSTL